MIILLIIGLLCYLITCPEASLSAAREGINLWLFVLLPTLFPFFLCTHILMELPVSGVWRRKLELLGKFAFGTSYYGTYVLLFGIFCGYPVGARLTGELYAKQRITRNEAYYLLSFVNQPSPIFLTSYICQTLLAGRYPASALLIPFYFAVILSMILSRFLFRRGFHPYQNSITRNHLQITPISYGSLLTDSIWSSLSALAIIGGYVLLFSVIASPVQLVLKDCKYLPSILTGFLELSNGIHALQSSSMNVSAVRNLSLIMSSLGGICIFMQTKSLMSESNLSMRPYITGKFRQTILLICLLLVSQII